MSECKEDETMPYQICTVYQKEDLQGLSKAYYYTKRPLRMMQKILNGSYFGVGLLLLVMFLMLLIGIPGMVRMAMAHEDKRVFSFVMTSIALAFAFLAFGLRMITKSNVPIGAKAAWRLYKQKGESLCFRFDTCHFVLERPNVRSEYEYGLILRILEDKARFYLFDTAQTAFILPKRDFEQGSADAFRDFIGHTTGKPVEYMK